MHGRRRGEPVSCKDPIGFETLLAWWLGELPDTEEAPVEEHLFGCAHCTRRAEELAALGEGIRAAVHGGRVSAVISKGFLERLLAQGLRLREYVLAPGERVNCTLLADEDAVVSRVRAPLAGAKRIDVVRRVDVGGVRVHESRIEDVPFDPAAGEVLLVPSAAALRAMPAHTHTVRLVAVDDQGERTLGEYTFAHTPP